MARVPFLIHGAVPTDLFHLVAGDRIGQGIAREVYVYKIDPSLVIKFEVNGEYDFQNVHEWEVWTQAPDWARRWLAPCIDISPSGRVLLQRRMDPMTRPPRRVPSFLADLHAYNWGVYKGHPVAVDYGRHRLLGGAFKRRMVKTPEVGAKW